MKTITENGQTYELREYKLDVVATNPTTGNVAGTTKCPYCGRNVGVNIKGKIVCTTNCFCRARFSAAYVDGDKRYARSPQPIKK